MASKNVYLHPSGDESIVLYPVTKVTNLLDSDGLRLSGGTVTSIGVSATDAQIPTAKAVYDSVNSKITSPSTAGTANQVLKINSSNAIVWGSISEVPAVPSQTGTYTLKCVNGVIGWVLDV